MTGKFGHNLCGKKKERYAAKILNDNKVWKKKKQKKNKKNTEKKNKKHRQTEKEFLFKGHMNSCGNIMKPYGYAWDNKEQEHWFRAIKKWTKG